MDKTLAKGPPQTTLKPGTSNSHREGWILAATILGSSMAFIDGTVVNVALPFLQKDLQATSADVQWVVESYTLFLAALILVGGSLGDHFGRKRIYIIGIIIFTIASVLCGFAPNILVLIIARGIQGVGGALLVPGSLAIISASFSGPQRGKAIGTWSGFTTITSAFGPALGGWLVQNISWRLVFFINLPMAVAVLAIVFWRVPESSNPTMAKGLDYWGAVLATVGLGGLIYGLVEAGNSSFTNGIVIVSLIIGVLSLAAFVVVEVVSPHPMMPLHLFRSRTFSGTNLLTLLLYGALGGIFYFLPFDLIQVQGYSATAAGFVNLPFVFLMFGLSRWSGSLVGRFGSKLPLIIGPIIAGIGFLLFALPDINNNYWVTFFPAIIVLGLGMTITVAPLTTTVMGAVSVNDSGVASGINNAVSRVAGLLAIAVFGIFMLTTFGNSLDNRLNTINPSAPIRQSINEQRDKLVQIELPKDTPPQTQTAVKQAINESFIDGFRLIMFISAGMAFFSSLASVVLIEGKVAKK